MAQWWLRLKEGRRPRLEDWRRAVSARLVEPAAGFMARSRLHPNLITGLGLLVSLGAAAAAAAGQLLAAGTLVLVSGVFDLLDGALARASHRTSRFGGVLDSTLDRVGEAAILLGLLIFFLREDSALGILLVNISLLSSGLVSYIKARAEGAGVACPVGVFTRPERIILLAAGLFLRQVIIALAIIAVLSLATAAQRLIYVWQQTRDRKE